MTTINNGVRRFTGKAVTVKKVWYFIRSVKVPVGSPVLLPAFQMKGGVTYGGDNIDKQTKMGHIIIKSADEHGIELTRHFILNNESIRVVKGARRSGDSVKVWHAMINKSVTKVVDGLEDVKLYPTEFGYRMPDDVEIQDGDDLVETSHTLSIIGKLQKSGFPLSNADIAAIKALYDYQNPGETTGNLDRIQTVAIPKVEKVTSTNTGTKVGLS